MVAGVDGRGLAHPACQFRAHSDDLAGPHPQLRRCAGRPAAAAADRAVCRGGRRRRAVGVCGGSGVRAGERRRRRVPAGGGLRDQRRPGTTGGGRGGPRPRPRVRPIAGWARATMPAIPACTLAFLWRVFEPLLDGWAAHRAARWVGVVDRAADVALAGSGALATLLFLVWLTKA